jgi:hypothetical protein
MADSACRCHGELGECCPGCTGPAANQPLQGLITGRTNTLLLDPKNADMMTKKVVAAVQSHEVAHMWWVIHSLLKCIKRYATISRFGNLTTMEWWDYLYLNEGRRMCHLLMCGY